MFKFTENKFSSMIIALLVVSVLLSAVRVDNVFAAQLANRSLFIGSSANGSLADGQNVDYEFTFDFISTSNVGSIKFQFCSNSPIVGDSCTAPTGFATNEGAGLTLDNQTNETGFSISTADSDTNTIVITRAPQAVTAATSQYDFGGVDNPETNNQTFYARVTTHASTNGTGAAIDEGGIAVSTAEQIELTARVQETLTFCIGVTDSNSSGNCTDISGNTIDLDVLDPTVVNVASDTESTAGSIVVVDGSAYARLSTNAQNGAIVQYSAPDLASSGGNNIDAVGATEAAISAGTEKWGLTVDNIDTSDGITTNLVRTSNYDNNIGYAFFPNTLTTIASSTAGATASNRVIDNEQLEIDFAAAVSAITPTGVYTTTITFIATGTF